MSLLPFLLLLLVLFAQGAQAQTTTLKITPITFDIIGLDSNKVNSGPNIFIVGARVCNIGSATASNVTAKFFKTGANNPFINLQDLDTYSTPSLPPGPDPDPANNKQYMYPNPTLTALPANCFDFYFNGVITRTNSAYFTKQDYYIQATATNAPSVQTPAGRALYIEKLVSQNRNSVVSLTGPTAVEVGKTYQYTLVVNTATGGYEQIEHFPNFPNNQFQILAIQTSYAEPTNQKNQIAWADACGWVYLLDFTKSNPNQSYCSDIVNISGGKAGGDPITTVYTVKILGPGNGAIQNLVYDYSGSSYHYNSDYNTGGAISFTSVYSPNLTVTKTTSTPTVWRNPTGNTANYTITISNSSVANTGTASNVVVSDPLPAGFTYNSTGTITLAGGASRTTTSNPTAGATTPNWGTFSIPAGGSVTIPFTVNIPTSVPVGTYQNPVTVTYTSPDGTTGNQKSYDAASSTAEDITLRSLDCTSLYAVLGNSSAQASVGTRFVTLNPLTGAISPQFLDITSVGGVPSVTGGFGISASQLKIIYVDGNGGSGYGGIARIYTSNGGTPVNTTHTVAAPTAEHQVGVDKNGVLWTTVWNGNKNLYTYNGSGNATSLGTITAADPALQDEWFDLAEGDFAFDNAGNMWFISSPGNTSQIALWLVDTTTRKAYKVNTFNLSGGFAKGAEFGPDGQLYIGVTNPSTVTRGVIIYKYNPFTGQLSLLNAQGGSVSTDFDDIQDMGSCIYPDTSDSGDAPSNYGTVTHIVRDALYLGSNGPDREVNQTSNTATADDTMGSDDEDAFASLPAVVSVSSSYSLNVPVFNDTDLTARLVGWIDLNRNNVFEASEGRSVNVPDSSSAQTVTLTWSGLSGLSQGATFARFRLSTDSALSTSTPTGLANSGEVEDYPINIVSNADFGDAPASYQSAFHGISASIRMGAVAPDSESASQSSATASGDDTNSTDDEDVLSGTINVAQAGTYTLSGLSVSNTTGSTARLVGWIDFNRNGTFDSTEGATVNVNSGAGSQTVSLSWSVPSDAQTGSSFLRLRFTTDTSVATGTASTSVPYGFASNGEVEDHAVSINLYPVSGTVFEDVNYGGGAGRNLATANSSAVASGFSTGAVAREGVRVELYTGGGAFITSTTTNASGQYTFPVPTGSYQIRVVNSTVSSMRSGWVNTLIPVQTFRTNASTGTAVAVTSKVGGEDPSQTDAPANTSSTLTTLNAATGQEVQSLAPVTVGTAAISGMDFGFNFDTIVNTNNTGQGSVRQFALNASTLGDEAKLAQSGSRKTLGNTNESLPAGFETSIFMVPAANLTLNVGVITLASTVQITGANAVNTILDGTTQTVNIADGNTGQLGTGGTVGIGPDLVAGNGDDTVLNRIFRPEIELKSLTGSIAGMGLQIGASNVTVRGISIYGFGSAANTDNNANIQIENNQTGILLEQNFLGIAATRSAFDCSASAATAVATGGGDNIRSVGADDGTVRHNLIGCSAGKGFGVENGSERWQILGNEIRGNAIGNMHLDGIDVENGTSGQATVRGNLIVNNWGVGVDSYDGAGGNTTEFNTIEGNGIGTSGSMPLEDAGIRIYGTGSTVRYNIVRNNVGSGIMVQATSGSNVFTQNVIYNNGKIGIDLLNSTDDVTKGNTPFVTLNDLNDTDTGGNTLLNYPVFATATLVGNTLEITGYARPGATIELFLSDSDASGFGEGQVYLGTVTEGCAATNLTTCLAIDQDSSTGTYGPAAINGVAQGTDTTNRFQFAIPLGVLKGSVTLGSKLSATATLSGYTSEFSGQVPVTTRITGTVFEDVNYGGGAGRNLATAEASAVASGFAAGATARPGATVELYSSAGAYLANTTTDSAGQYTFHVGAGSYQVRVVNSTVSSARSGWVNTLRPVQTFRTNASTGTAVAVTNRVGGEVPAETDAPANTSSTLATLNGVTGQEVQSLAPVTVSMGSVSGVDFGFNFDTIVNIRDSGQGSIRQFVVNANTLGDEAKLAQSGNRKGLNNANEALPAGKETSIFMVPQPAAPPTPWVASIQLNSALQFVAVSAPTAANATHTILDGTTQTVNIGDTNTGVLGTGGTVGTGVDGLAGNGDDTALNQIQRPEVQLFANSSTIPGIGLDVQASNITVRGLSVYGFGTSPNSDAHANIRIDGASGNFIGTLIEQNFLGIAATRPAFNCPTGGATGTGDSIRSVGGDTGTIQNNLIGCVAGKGIGLENGSVGWQVLGNEVRGNAIGNANFDGIDIEGGTSGNTTVRGNLFAYNGGVGVDTHVGLGNNTIDRNTIEFNGQGTGSSLEDAGSRIYGNNNTVQHNIIRSNVGSGIMVQPGSTGNLISKNAIHQNGKIGIDLMATGDTEKTGTAPYVTLNDLNDTDTGANTLLNFPVFSSASLQGGVLTLSGYARPGAVIELFLAHPDPSGFGEGQTYLGTFTEGCTTISATCLATDGDAGTGTYGPAAVNGILQGTDTTSRFQFSVPVSSLLAPVALGNPLTATATLSGNTSEFSGLVTVSVAGFSISGTVYEDLQPNGLFEPTENWTAGSMVHVNLVQGGNVVASTSVPAGSGAFSFANVNAGTYTLAVSSVAGTVGTPAPAVQAPTGWLYTSPAGGTLQLDVAGTVTGQNFGLYHGSRVSGRVFYDNAFGATSLADESKANNGLQDLSEKGAGGVTVTATAGSSTVSAVTSANGDFQMYLPHSTFNGQNVVLGHQVQPATGNSLNNTLPVQLASTLNDGLAATRTFSNMSGQVYGTHFFGILPSANWRPDQSGTTSSPGIIDYTHSYIPQTLGALSFTTAGNLFYSVYGDTNCDGTVSEAEKNVNLLVNPVQVGFGWPRLNDGSFKPCEFHVLVSVPSNLAPNSVDRVKVKAELAWTGSTVKNPLYVLDTTTTRTLATGGKLSLTKGLRNVTAAETSYTVSNGGKVGDIIEYKITFTNSGDTEITDIVLGDNVPYFTDMVQNVYGGTGEMELHCPNGTVVNVHLGQVSVIDLPLNLPTSCNITQMLPGAFGYFLYQVKIR